MNTEKKKRISNRLFLLNGAIFIFGAFIAFSDGKILFATLQVLAGISNWLMLIPADKEMKDRFYYIVLIFNIIIALATSIDYFISGKKYIQYAWLIVAVTSLVVFIIHIRKKDHSRSKEI